MAGDSGLAVMTIAMQIITVTGAVAFGLRKSLQLVGGLLQGEKDAVSLHRLFRRDGTGLHSHHHCGSIFLQFRQDLRNAAEHDCTDAGLHKEGRGIGRPGEIIRNDPQK